MLRYVSDIMSKNDPSEITEEKKEKKEKDLNRLIHTT